MGLLEAYLLLMLLPGLAGRVQRAFINGKEAGRLAPTGARFVRTRGHIARATFVRRLRLGLGGDLSPRPHRAPAFARSNIRRRQHRLDQRALRRRVAVVKAMPTMPVATVIVPTRAPPTPVHEASLSGSPISDELKPRKNGVQGPA